MCRHHDHRNEHRPFTFPPEAPLPLIPSKWEIVSESLYGLALILTIGGAILYFTFL